MSIIDSADLDELRDTNERLLAYDRLQKAEIERLRALLREADTVFQIYEREATGRLRNAMADIPMRVRQAIAVEQEVKK